MSHCPTPQRPEVKIHVCFGDRVTKSPLRWPVWHYLERLLRGLVSFPPHSKHRRLFRHKRADLRWEIKRSRSTGGSFTLTSGGTWTQVMEELEFMRHFCPVKTYHMSLQIKLLKTITTKTCSVLTAFFHVLVLFTSFKRIAGWLQERVGKLLAFHSSCLPSCRLLLSLLLAAPTDPGRRCWYTPQVARL